MIVINNIEEITAKESIELLKYMSANDIIDISSIQKYKEMTKRQELLKKHQYKIHQGKDGYWRTYLPDEKCGRKMVKKKEHKDLEDTIINYYKLQQEQEKLRSFDNVYWSWRNIQDQLVMDNTVTKYNTDYIRYFKDTPFAEMEITKITEDDIKIFIVHKVKELELCQKACKTLYGYIRNTVLHARKNKLLIDDPIEFIKAKDFYKYCMNQTKSVEKQTVSQSDMDLLYEQFYRDYKDKPEYIPTYAVHLATLTGMRVGEISALRWDSITKDYIIIDKSEKYSRSERKYYIEQTKNKKSRVFPLTPQIRSLLNAVQKAEMKNGYLSEFVFSNEHGRINAPTISSCSKNKCKQVGIDEKGIHAYRKTLNSKMRCDGVSSTVAASLLGHTKEVNEQYYTFDITSLREKADIITRLSREA